MTIKLTSAEKRLVNHAKKAVVTYNKLRQSRGGIDTLYSFLLSKSGKIYNGACFEPSIAQASVCGERHAITNMILHESYKSTIRSIVVADPVPKEQEHGTTPCGTCRHLIWEFGSPNTTVLCLQYIRQKNGWTFPKIEKFTIKKLYPNAYKPVQWPHDEPAGIHRAN